MLTLEDFLVVVQAVMVVELMSVMCSSTVIAENNISRYVASRGRWR
jgi:hypothetical protein